MDHGGEVKVFARHDSVPIWQLDIDPQVAAVPDDPFECFDAALQAQAGEHIIAAHLIGQELVAQPEGYLDQGLPPFDQLVQPLEIVLNQLVGQAAPEGRQTLGQV